MNKLFFEIKKLILNLYIAPIRLLSNIVLKPKNSLIEYHFNYGYIFCQIKVAFKNPSINDHLLIASYILFLSRYFYICDERQIGVMKSFLLENICKNKPNIPEISQEIYNTIFQTLNENEKYAARKLFQSNPLRLPPLTYSEDKERRFSLTKYSFIIFESNGKISSIFKMSFGADIILLPLTVWIFYCFLIEKLKDKNKKMLLDNTITQLLKSYEMVDCRSRTAVNELTSEILESNGVWG